MGGQQEKTITTSNRAVVAASLCRGAQRVATYTATQCRGHSALRRGGRQSAQQTVPSWDSPRSPSQGKCRRTRATRLSPKGSIALLRICAMASSTESVA